MTYTFVTMDWVLTKIREFRKSKGYSQEQLADLLNIEQKTYSNWERGRTDMTIQNLQKIALALNIDVKELWDESKWISKPAIKQYDPPVSSENGVSEDSNPYLLSSKTNVAELQKEIMMLKEQNLALTRAYNELFEKKRESKSVNV